MGFGFECLGTRMYPIAYSSYAANHFFRYYESMKARLFIAASLFVATFIGMVICFTNTAIYCKQSFSGQSVPFICADTQADASALVKIGFSVVGWILLFGLPTLIAILYARFGWPRLSSNE